MGLVRILFVLLLLQSIYACGGNSVNTSDVFVDGDLTVTRKTIIASEGGTIKLPDGASLFFPPEALTEDTEIVVTTPTSQDKNSRSIIYKLEPSGLTFSVPVEIKVPYEDHETTGLDPLPMLTHYSALNEPYDSGSEISTGQFIPIIEHNTDDNYFIGVLEHFSFITGLRIIDELQYLIFEIPIKHLEPADILFSLTENLFVSDFLDAIWDGKSVGWVPGHIGMVNSTISNNLTNIVESTSSDDERKNGVREWGFADFMTGNNHIYMGARRPKGGLSTVERVNILTAVRDQIGKDYDTIGDGNITEDGFSCVGLVENGLDSIGRGVLNFAREATISTPLEMFLNTVPVTEITVDAGESVQIPIKGVMADYSLTYPLGTYRVDLLDYEIEAVAGLPAGAEFRIVGEKKHYLIWTPQPEDSGNTFNINFDLTPKQNYLSQLGGYLWETITSPGVDTIINGWEDFLEDGVSQTLTIHVNPLPDEEENNPPSAILSPSSGEVEVGGSVSLNSTGSTDPDNDPLFFVWKLDAPAGSISSLDNNDDSINQFICDIEGQYKVQVVADDGMFQSAPATGVFDCVYPVPPACGDGEINQSLEECDGTDLGGETCVTLGYESGSLSCTSSCTYNESECVDVFDPQGQLLVPKTTFTFAHTINSSPCPQLIDYVEISNPGGVLIDWEATGAFPSWISMTPISGSVNSGETVYGQLSFTCDGSFPAAVETTIDISAWNTGDTTKTNVQGGPTTINVSGVVDY